MDESLYDLLWLREDYYRDIGQNLTDKETENFILYAQHHSLPTELLDITANYLVALYFACERDFEQDGFVYLFDNNSKSYENPDSSKFYDNLYHDLTKPLINKNIGKQYLRFRWMRKIDDGMVQKELWENANQFAYNLLSESNPELLIKDAYLEFQKLKSEKILQLN